MSVKRLNYWPPSVGLLLALLLMAILIPAASAETLIIDIDDIDSSSTNDVYTGGTSRTIVTGGAALRGVGIYVKQIQTVTDPYSLVYFFDGSETWLHISDPSIRYNSSAFTATYSYTLVATGTITYNLYPGSNAGYIVVEFDTWTPGGLTGDKYMTIIPQNGLNGMRLKGYSGGSGTSNNQIVLTQVGAIYSGASYCYIDDPYIASGTHTQNSVITFQSQITGDIDGSGACKVVVSTDSKYPSTVKISPKYHGEYITDIEKTNEPIVSYTGSQEYKPIKVEIYSEMLEKWYTYYLFDTGEPGDPGTPTDPGETPIMRTGSVTMTDNNGTTITGFEVTAVNAYTGQSYNVSTDTDIAVMTLPMDRTIRLRNPQTGEYEDAPVGYYRFYGQSPGYKMLNEDGIKVSVMPEKYGSYQLCDILVRSESGYLTGKHQFQIRSRSDNSILQTGTISAKSATTNQWYNATVTGGIATIVLPYDTSNTQSQYAGNYYVYATSPGYQDSDYGTQIVVMPHTVSETKIILLTPIGGVPTPGNVTLRIQAFSETGPGVVNAEIFISGVIGAGSSVWDTYTASSTGYLTVSVPGNSTYDIVASGDGYYDSARRVEVFTEDPPLIEIKLYLSGAPTVEPTTQPTGWPTDHPTTQPTGGIPDDDDGSGGFLMQAVRGIGLAFGVGFATAKLIFGMLLALSIGYATAKQLRGGAAEFGLGLLGGTLLGVLIGLLPVWVIVVLLLVVGLYIGNRYVRGGNNG